MMTFYFNIYNSLILSDLKKKEYKWASHYKVDLG